MVLFIGSYHPLLGLLALCAFVGVGGSFRNLGRISRMIRKYPFNMTHNYELPVTEFDNIYNTIKKLDLDSTMKIKGLSSGRADIFPSALAEMKAVLSRFPFAKITISGCGLREGAMFRYAVPSVNERPLSDVLGHSLYTQMRYFDINIEHAEHVYNLSIQLFKQLKVLHKMSRMRSCTTCIWKNLVKTIRLKLALPLTRRAVRVAGLILNLKILLVKHLMKSVQ